MDFDVDFDGELRRMVDGISERLDIPVRPGADLVILAGARRVRRRRRLAATAGALTVALLVGGGIAMAANGSRNSLPPAETTTLDTTTTPSGTTTTTTTTTTTKARPAKPAGTERDTLVVETPVDDPPTKTVEEPPPSLTDGVLTATGYGPFELGMSADAALATGLLTLTADGGDCASYSINGGGGLLISGQVGITRVDLPEWVRTPEGLGAGATVGEVRAVHPGATDYRNGVTADTGAGSFYEFVTVEAPPLDEPVPDTHVVGELRLSSTANDCALAM